MNIKLACQTPQFKREIYIDNRGRQFAILETSYYENTNNEFRIYSQFLSRTNSTHGGRECFATQDYYEARNVLVALMEASHRSYSLAGRIFNFFHRI